MQTVTLFFIAVLFMLLFQVEARLVGYVYTFHEGVILIESILLGGGFFLLLQSVFSSTWKQCLQRYVGVFVAGAFFLHILLFFIVGNFYLTLISLSILFGLLFWAITGYINLPARVFYGTELLGSFAGVALYALAVSYVLEETILLSIGGVLTLCGLWSVRKMVMRNTEASMYVLALVVTGMSFFVYVSAHPLPQLITCDTYKAPCTDVGGRNIPNASFTHLKGRTDVYLTERFGVRVLTARSAGLHSGTTVHREDVGKLEGNPFDTEVPALAYRSGSAVLALGAATGANVQSLQKYIAHPDIIAVDIDGTVGALYADPRFSEYLPEQESYQWEYGEARTYLERTQGQYDVIVAGVESVNTNSPTYVDESTSFLYTEEAFRSYLAKLTSGGYLLLVQYMPLGVTGEAMTNKLLATLASATGAPREALAEQVILYTSAFSRGESAQRFVTVVYKTESMSSDDIEIFTTWQAVTDEVSPVEILHVPGGIAPPQYDFFDTHIEATPVTDSRPFRHMVTTLPFPPVSYAFFGLFTALFLAVLGRVAEVRKVPTTSIILSALFGIGTFGLQYLLFYKTAAFLNTSLIFFSVFLVIPLFFSAIGGFISTLLSKRQLMFASIIALAAAVLLATLDIFSQAHLLIFVLIAILFVYAGFLFPLLIGPINDTEQRAVLYAVNIFAGGLAFLLLVTLHATLGWTLSFTLVTAVLISGVWWLKR